MKLGRLLELIKNQGRVFMYQRMARFSAWLLLVLFFSGCGETIHGVGKDVSRVGRGVKTIFVSGN
ncbi:MAG: hypothetical protein A2036_01855 [Omnitrophica bacterium GWA2_50_21]|nr:MAG: hypothetical protein A2036_01855 [Omnitrophica bacterium GWA2_50_21]